MTVAAGPLAQLRRHGDDLAAQTTSLANANVAAMIKLDQNDIRNALPRVKKGLDQYVDIQSRLHSVDVSEDVDFQKMFTVFYRVRRNKEWRSKYFSILQTAKREGCDFEEALKRIHQQTGRIEASFASKLAATIDTRLPVIDSIVMRNVGKKLPYRGAKNRQEIVVKQHEELRELRMST